MRKYKYIPTICLLTLTAACLAAGCRKREKIDLTTTEAATAAPETMSPESAPAARQTSAAGTMESSQDSSVSGTQSGTQASSAVKKVTARINTYTSGNVSLQYPSVQNLDDEEQTGKVDALLKENALSILNAWGINDTDDTLDVKCQIMSADRNYVTAVYTGTITRKGAAYPANIFYSNTVNIRKISNVKLTDFVDYYTMAGYVLSDDCEFYNASEELTAELMKAKNEKTIEQYSELFKNADFPLKNDAGGEGFGTFPGTFSYEHEGTIFFSIPVSHALGDYAIVKYTPDTK